MDADPPADVLCERCWTVVRHGEQVVRFGYAVGSTLRGDITWAYTYLHHYDPDEGCVRGAASVWD